MKWSRIKWKFSCLLHGFSGLLWLPDGYVTFWGQFTFSNGFSRCDKVGEVLRLHGYGELVERTSAEWLWRRHKDSTYLLASCPITRSILCWLQPSLTVVWKRTNQGSSIIEWVAGFIEYHVERISEVYGKESCSVWGGLSAFQILKFLFDLSYVISTFVWLRTEYTKATCSV